jgi:hypothetical protein
LEIEKVGIEDNFFHLGGHSLLAVKLLSQVLENFGLDVPIKIIFVNPTIYQFANVIDVMLLNQTIREQTIREQTNENFEEGIL